MSEDAGVFSYNILQQSKFKNQVKASVTNLRNLSGNNTSVTSGSLLMTSSEKILNNNSAKN